MIVRVSGLPGQIAVFPAEMFAGAFTTQDDDDDKWRVIVSVTHASSPIFGPWESADDAAACLETVLMSVGAVAEPGEPEAALDTVTLALPEPVLTVDEAQQALGMAAIEVGLQGVLTGVHVVVDMTGAEATTVMAVSEIVTKLCKRGAKSIEFVTDNNGVAEHIKVTLIVNKIASLLPVTLVDNSGSKPEAQEPAETGTVADPANVATTDFDGCTYHYNAATGELSKDEGDGPVIVTTVASNTKVYVEQDAEQTYAVVGFIDKARIPFTYLSEGMEFCGWLTEQRRHAAINGVEYDIFRQTVLFKVDGVCRCEWDPAASTLVIRFVDGSTQVCTRVTPGVWTPRRLAGESVGWLDTLTGSEHVVFETEEQAETFVARLAEAFEKGKA